ncbi:MAG: NADH-quinone oxidoreductase subunit F, partial [Candidatus Delongbacteria bacterium]|nr:NADH-quinone oxidoreductase subunit F [Candidatus Delongbacteria bacterium]
MNYRVLVGLGSCGIAAGAQPVLETLQRLLHQSASSSIQLDITGCNGMCYKEPLVSVLDGSGQEMVYGEVDSARAERIFQEHLVNDHPIVEWIIKGHPKASEKSYYENQTRIVLENCGEINPEKIEEYLARKGYQGLRRALIEMKPEDVIAEIKQSGLRGRGGGGFSTGLKWELARKSAGSKKYIICNGDEGDPGAFMDRSVMESDPHRVLEGMAIAAYAIGADEAYLYVRAEYPLAIKRLKLAIAQAESAGYLGRSMLGTSFNLEVHIKEGAGAFVCGEETALIASIEGKRGMPRFRPPFPAEAGLWGKPTNINNVETYANVPWIMREGAAAFRRNGTDKSPGTKVFALAGKIKRGGLIEV